MARLPSSLWIFLVAVLGLVPHASEAIGADSKWGPFCGKDQPNDPPAGYAWKLWSDPRTWGLPNRGVPGVGPLRRTRVVIPCATFILLDVRDINVELLDIHGTLRVLDSGAGTAYSLTAAAILVQGTFLIGTRTMAFRPKITITLANAPRGKVYSVTRPALDGFSFPPVMQLDTKVMAVIGGRVHFYGFPGPAYVAGWTRLRSTAAKGTNKLNVVPNLAGRWPVGGRVIVASSDYDLRQTEEFTIVAISASTITLSASLQFNHYGGTVSTGMGTFIDESSEVALISRNILVQGQVDQADPLIGGHFIVYHTQNPRGQIIDGVEFFNMGQQGVLGRYPVHFHLCQDARPSLVSRCSVHHSNQRCYTTHGTHWLTLQGNICYKNKGHGFILEDGVEMNNTWDSNLAVWQEAVLRLIKSGPGGAVESDDQPSGFWVTNTQNTFVNNAAAGSFFAGFWIQVSNKVRGPSAGYPEAKGLSPMELGMKRFDGNTAHSSAANFRSYPDGWKPPAYPLSKISNFRAWKAARSGLFLHRTLNLVIEGAQLADNLVGVTLFLCDGVVVSKSRITGETENTGNPKCPPPNSKYCPGGFCPDVRCAPVNSCQMPPAAGTPTRSTAGFRFKVSAGILFQGYHSLYLKQLLTGSHVVDTAISRFPSVCNVPRAAIVVTSVVLPRLTYENAWLTSHSISGIKFDEASTKVRFIPTIMASGKYVDLGVNQGAMGNYLTLRDIDGSVTGVPGFLVKDTKAFAANERTNNFAGNYARCQATPSVVLGLSCPRACFRTVIIYWRAPAGARVDIKRPAFRFIRNADGATIDMHPEVVPFYTPPVPYVAVNLLASQTYRVVYLHSTDGVPPMSFSAGLYGDSKAMCSGGITLQFPRPANRLYTVAKKLVGGGCQPSGAGFDPPTTSGSWTCIGRRPYLQLSLATRQDTFVDVDIASGGRAGCAC